MKEIKRVLYTLLVAAYTSLWWATCIWKGIRVGPNNLPVGLMLLGATTLAFIILIGKYVVEHWDDDKKA